MGDLGTSNVKSFKQLGVSEKAHSFRFHYREIAALIDPYLLIGGMLGCKSVSTPGRVVIWWTLQQTISIKICCV